MWWLKEEWLKFPRWPPGEFKRTLSTHTYNFCLTNDKYQWQYRKFVLPVCYYFSLKEKMLWLTGSHENFQDGCLGGWMVGVKTPLIMFNHNFEKKCFHYYRGHEYFQDCSLDVCKGENWQFSPFSLAKFYTSFMVPYYSYESKSNCLICSVQFGITNSIFEYMSVFSSRARQLFI